MITLYHISSPEANKILSKDKTTLNDLEAECKILGVTRYPKQVLCVPIKEVLTPTFLQKILPSGNWFIFYEPLDKKHPDYMYYSVIGFRSQEDISSVTVILKAHKLKAFL